VFPVPASFFQPFLELREDAFNVLVVVKLCPVPDKILTEGFVASQVNQPKPPRFTQLEVHHDGAHPILKNLQIQPHKPFYPLFNKLVFKHHTIKK